MTEEESFCLLNGFIVSPDGAMSHHLGDSNFRLVISGMPGAYGWSIIKVCDEVVSCSDDVFDSPFDAFDDWFFARSD